MSERTGTHMSVDVADTGSAAREQAGAPAGGLRVLWCHLCEGAIFDGEAVQSVQRIVRAGVGLGVRALPLTIHPTWWFSLLGEPGSPLEIVVQLSAHGHTERRAHP